MRNVSLHSERITLNPGSRYFVIDTLYVNDLAREDLPSVGPDAFIRDRVFSYPHAQTMFVLIDIRERSEELVVHVGDILSVTDEVAEANVDSCFVTDTGLIVFVREENLSDLVSALDFYELVDTNGAHETVDLEYWDRIAGRYHLNDLALMVSPGLDSGYEFVGSGLYMIDIEGVTPS